MVTPGASSVGGIQRKSCSCPEAPRCLPLILSVLWLRHILLPVSPASSLQRWDSAGGQCPMYNCSLSPLTSEARPGLHPRRHPRWESPSNFLLWEPQNSDWRLSCSSGSCSSVGILCYAYWKDWLVACSLYMTSLGNTPQEIWILFLQISNWPWAICYWFLDQSRNKPSKNKHLVWGGRKTCRKKRN